MYLSWAEKEMERFACEWGDILYFAVKVSRALERLIGVAAAREPAVRCDNVCW